MGIEDGASGYGHGQHNYRMDWIVGTMIICVCMLLKLYAHDLVLDLII